MKKQIVTLLVLTVGATGMISCAKKQGDIVAYKQSEIVIEENITALERTSNTDSFTTDNQSKIQDQVVISGNVINNDVMNNKEEQMETVQPKTSSKENNSSVKQLVTMESKYVVTKRLISTIVPTNPPKIAKNTTMEEQSQKTELVADEANARMLVTNPMYVVIKRPVVTKRPCVTSTPVATKKPVATATPVPTKDPSSGSAENGATNASYSTKVLELVNEQRKANGLSALTTTSALQQAADKRAKEIVSNFSHTRPDGTSGVTVLPEYSISYRAWGENIAYGQRTPAAVMDAWMNSSGHRANILSSKFGKVGIGCYEKNGTLYWTQVFTD